MPLIRANAHLFVIALGVSAAAACAAIFSPGAAAGDRLGAKESIHTATTIEARVVRADGSPVEGAVVVTSAGGQGVSGDDGDVRFTVELDPMREHDAMYVTAVAVIGGVNHAGSVEVELAPHRHDADAGVIVLSAEGECEPAWIPTFRATPGMSSNSVYALTVFDDGSGAGPALYAAGNFILAGGETVNRIAKWNGVLWQPLGDGMNNPVLALTVFDDGSGAGPALYAAGDFTMAGGETAHHIAKWNGESWSPLGAGMNDWVNALAVFDDGSGAGPALYAGGAFTTAGGEEANRIARWDGESWSPPGSGTSGPVRDLAVFDDGSGAGPALYAAGQFGMAGDVPASRIARWDGESWSPVGSGMNDSVRTLTVFDDGSGAGPALYAGGDFTLAGGEAANYIAKWNGAEWSPLKNGPDDSVWALTVYDDGAGPALYAAGQFTTVGGMEANRIVKWDGESWSPRGHGMSNRVRALTVFDDGSGALPVLYAGGDFITAGDETANGIAKWDRESWWALGDAIDDAVWTLTVFDDGAGPALYVGGDFTMAGGVTANHIARWDGESWSSLDTGMNDTVRALTVFDDGAGPALYAAGRFTTAGGVEANHIAKWDGVSWSPLGSGMGGVAFPVVLALKVFDDGSGPALYAGGAFTTAGGETAHRIAKWDDASWSPLGSGVSGGSVSALTVFDDGAGPALYAGGGFSTAGDETVNHIAKWDGVLWQPLGDGMNNSVLALTIFDDDSGAGPALYAGGYFNTASGVTSNRIAKWDGKSWSPLGGGVNGSIRALTAFNDGSGAGPALYAGGNFSSAGGATASRIAKWDGASWQSLGVKMHHSVYALAVFNRGSGVGSALYVGGKFKVTDSIDPYLAKFQSCPIDAGIPGDLNGDGVVNAQDLGILLGSWGPCPSEPAFCPADINSDGVVNAQDLAILLGDWGATAF